MTEDERKRLVALEKTTQGFNIVTKGVNVEGGFGKLKRNATESERLAHLEQIHANFQIVGGPNVTVEGSIFHGYAICATCPDTGAATGSGVPQPVPPTITGACCSEDGTCTIQSQATCESSGGTYQGDGTDCDPNPCPEPGTGACCVDDVCSIETESDCTGMGGIYYGDGTPCDPDPCGSCISACRPSHIKVTVTPTGEIQVGGGCQIDGPPYRVTFTGAPVVVWDDDIGVDEWIDFGDCCLTALPGAILFDAESGDNADCCCVNGQCQIVLNTSAGGFGLRACVVDDALVWEISNTIHHGSGEYCFNPANVDWYDDVTGLTPISEGQTTATVNLNNWSGGGSPTVTFVAEWEITWVGC